MTSAVLVPVHWRETRTTGTGGFELVLIGPEHGSWFTDRRADANEIHPEAAPEMLYGYRQMLIPDRRRRRLEGREVKVTDFFFFGVPPPALPPRSEEAGLADGV